MKTRGDASEACVVCAGGVREGRCEECGAPLAPAGFQVIRLLAKTPHSRVFLAERGGQRVALKELLFAMVPDAQQLEAFEREAELLAQLRHPRIPKLVASFREGTGARLRLYLAQEFVAGRSLLEELSEHRFEEKAAREVAREVLEILRYLHGLSPRVIHRDVKPANLMRCEDGRVTLVDFGAARDLVGGHTHGSTLVGTFGYMPPEQLGGTVDATCDLYALGATLLHLLSRRAPDQLLRKGLELEVGANVNVSPGFCAFLERLVHADRQQRFQSPEEALAALRQVDAPRVSVDAQLGAPRRGRGRPRVFLFMGAAFALAVLVTAGALVFARTKEVPVAKITEPAFKTVEPIDAPVRTSPPVNGAKAPTKAREKSGVPAGFEVVTLEERPAATRTRPTVPELKKDFRAKVDETIELRASSCPGATPTLVLRTLRLQANGGTLAHEPASRLTVEFTQLANGAAVYCGTTSVSVAADSSAGSTRPESRNFAPRDQIVERSFEVQIPRTSQRATVVIGSAAKPDATFLVDLVAGTITRR